MVEVRTKNKEAQLSVKSVHVTNYDWQIARADLSRYVVLYMIFYPRANNADTLYLCQPCHVQSFILYTSLKRDHRGN